MRPSMTAARRALAGHAPTPALRRLLPPRPTLVGIVAAAAASTRGPARPPVASSVPPRRWHSVGNGSDAGDKAAGNASRVWSFAEVARQVEANSRSPPAKGQQKVVFVDVREHDELAATGKIPGAVNLPLMTAPHLVERPGCEDLARKHRPQPQPQPRDAHLVFYCRSGVRAHTAAQLASRAGWPSVGEYPGSWLEWEAHAGPVEKVPPES